VANKIKVSAFCMATCLGIFAGLAWAHSPLFPKGNHSLSTAYRIDGVDKSWVAYASIEQPDRADYYQFPRGRGQRIDLSLFSAGSPAVTGFRPSLALLVPGLDRCDTMPGFVQIPKNYGSCYAAN
jgi:hypothetical protein